MVTALLELEQLMRASTCQEIFQTQLTCRDAIGPISFVGIQRYNRLTNFIFSA